MTDPITITITINGLDPDRWLESALRKASKPRDWLEDALGAADPPIYVRPPRPPASTAPLEPSELVHHAAGIVGGSCTVAGCQTCPPDRRIELTREMACDSRFWLGTLLAYGCSYGGIVRALADVAASLCSAQMTHAANAVLKTQLPPEVSGALVTLVGAAIPSP